VAWHDDELGWLRPDGLVFEKGQAERFNAILAPALTEEVKAALDPLAALKRFDLFVHLAEENLVPTDPLFALHDEGLSPL
jgi:hypothetical protein